MSNLFDPTPKRFHPLFILYNILLSIKEFIFPIIIVFFFQFNATDGFFKYAPLVLLAYLIYRAIVSFFMWKNTTYLLTEKNIEFSEGRFVSKKRIIALDRIQSQHQHTTFVHKLFKLTSLTFVTGTDNIKLEMITQAEYERITSLFSQLKVTDADVAEEKLENDVTHTPISHGLTEHYLISWKEIILISFTSFYFLAIIPVVLTIYNRVADAFEKVEAYAQSFYAFITTSWLILTVIIILFLILASVIGVIITYLRFGKYRVTSDDKRIYITKGILNTTNFTISREKIRGVLIEKSFPRRFFGIYKVKLISLGDLAGEMELETDILFPFILKRRMEVLLPEIVPEYLFSKDTNRLPKKAIWANLLKPSYFFFIVTGIVLYFWPTLWYIPLALLVLIIVSRILEVKNARFQSNDQFVQFQTGAFSLDEFITSRYKIDTFEIKQSWIQRKFQLATLTITVREKPSRVVSMYHVTEDVAEEHYKAYRNAVLLQQR